MVSNQCGEKEDIPDEELMDNEWGLEQTIIFPIGNIKRILPMPFLQWNAAKGGGDTITGLLNLDSIRSGWG